MTNMDNEIIEIYLELISRYKGLIEYKTWDSKYKKTSKEHIYKMLLDIEINYDNYKTIDKISRFIGFIQGVLSSFGIIDVDEERILTRKLFQNIYKKYNIVQDTIFIK